MFGIVMVFDSLTRGSRLLSGNDRVLWQSLPTMMGLISNDI